MLEYWLRPSTWLPIPNQPNHKRLAPSWASAFNMNEVTQKFKFSDLEIVARASFTHWMGLGTLDREPQRYADGSHVLSGKGIEIIHTPTQTGGEGHTFVEALVDLAYNLQYAKEPKLRNIEIS